MGPLQLHAPVSTVILLLASMVVVGSSSAREAPSSSVYRFEPIDVVDANNGSGGFIKDDELARSADDTYLNTASYSQKEYLMEMKIGTPPRPFKAVADTGSDVIWTKRMELCSSSAKSRFASMECPSDNGYCNECKDGKCGFRKQYGSKKKVAEGVMARDMLTLWRRGGGPDKEKKVPISFGCASCPDDNGEGDADADCHRLLIPTSADGIVGLNRGPNSLLTQLGATKFSYCLSDPLKPEQSSPLWFGGSDLQLSFWDWEAIVQTTPLVKKARVASTSVWAYKYYIELEGVSVGNAPLVKVKVPRKGAFFKHKSLGGKGVMFVDSGCTYSRLESAAFDVLVDLLEKHLKANAFRSEKKHIRRACFRADAATSRPDVALHFSGGAAMRLPWSTYMLEPKHDGAPELICTAITNSSRNISILGNPQQQNMHMLFDLQEGAEKLSFVPVPDCSERKL